MHWSASVRAEPVVPPRPKWISLHNVDKYILLFGQMNCQICMLHFGFLFAILLRAAPVVPPRPKWISLHCVQTIWRNTIYLVDKYILLFRQRSFPIYISWLFFFCNLVRAAPVVPPRPKCANYLETYNSLC